MNKNTKDKDIENQETEINVEDGDNVSEEILLEEETTELEEVKSDEDIIIVQIAGLIARRIVCEVEQGQNLKQGVILLQIFSL